MRRRNEPLCTIMMPMRQSKADKVKNEILAVGRLFEGRLPQEVLLYALEYVQYNECGLALETMCQQLVEYEVQITRSEYDLLQSMAGIMYPNASVLKDLAHQVVA
jgi:hypothetical protein